MIQEIELNGVKVKVEITKEMARKVLEESEEIRFEDWYLYRNDKGVDVCTRWNNESQDFYRLGSDNCLYGKDYHDDYAEEYFDKRDARRAAEYRIKKAIEKMNGDKEKDTDMYYKNGGNIITYANANIMSSSPKYLWFNRSIGDYMLEHHKKDYKIYWGIE